jgi:hypothetical protein
MTCLEYECAIASSINENLFEEGIRAYSKVHSAVVGDFGTSGSCVCCGLRCNQEKNIPRRTLNRRSGLRTRDGNLCHSLHFVWEKLQEHVF